MNEHDDMNCEPAIPTRCAGHNCGTETAQHSPECILEAAIIQGWSTEDTLAAAKAVFDARATPPAAQVQGEQPDHVATDAFVPGSLADLLFQLGEKGVAVSGGTHGDRWRVGPPAALSAPPAAGVPEASYHCGLGRLRKDATTFVEVADDGAFVDHKAAVKTAAVIIRGLLSDDSMQLIREHRIALTPEYEGQWHADLYGDDGVAQKHAEGATPEEAVQAVINSEAPTPPASEPWRCQHCNSKTAQACYDMGCFGADAEPASEQQQAVVLPERKAYPDAEEAKIRTPLWFSRKVSEADAHNACLDELLRLNPHLAGVNQGVTTEAGNGGDA